MRSRALQNRTLVPSARLPEMFFNVEVQSGMHGIWSRKVSVALEMDCRTRSSFYNLQAGLLQLSPACTRSFTPLCQRTDIDYIKAAAREAARGCINMSQPRLFQRLRINGHFYGSLGLM